MERKLKYYENAECNTEKGQIDLTQIDDIDYSHVRDAGTHSIDLISDEKGIHYTLQTEDSETLHKWALAIKRCNSKYTKPEVRRDQTEELSLLSEHTKEACGIASEKDDEAYKAVSTDDVDAIVVSEDTDQAK